MEFSITPGTKFEYHTFLHHSQTVKILLECKFRFEYHTFLHHSQTILPEYQSRFQFEYHTFLHHSQTQERYGKQQGSLSTIHFYIILKPLTFLVYNLVRLSTIHFYIILKQASVRIEYYICLSTIHFYIILKLWGDNPVLRWV